MALRFSPSRGAASLVLNAMVRGPQGAAATVSVGTTTTGSAGSSASVTNSGTSGAAVFNFTVPRGDTGATGATGATGSAGATGSTGATGATGAASGIKQNYSSTTTDADPGNGIFRLNNATPASATAAYLDNLDSGGSTVSGIIDLWDDSTTTTKGFIRFEKSTDPTVWAEFAVTGSVVDGTGYRKLTLGSGAGSGAFTNTDLFAISFSRSGDKGADGAGTGDVSASANFATDNVIIRSDGTSKNVQLSAVAIDDSTGTTYPTVSDSGALGSATKMWGDLFLASGAVINFNNGNYTVTHSAGVLTLNGAFSIGTGNALTAGTIELGAASDTTLSRSAAGVIAVEGESLYPGIPVSSKSAAYTTVLGDANTSIYHPSTDNNARTFTIDSNANVAYPVGTFLLFENEINTLTIAITADTLTLAGTGSTGSRTLAANGVACAHKVASTKWIINGTGLT